MIVIPAIDIMDGSCVRLLRGAFEQRSTYRHTPLQIAREFESAGITHLHLVDLDGARSGRPVNLKVLETLATNTSLSIDYGGGIRNATHIRQAFEAGANQVNLGTYLFSEEELPGQSLADFGADRLIAAVDSKNGKVAINGWQQQTTRTVSGFMGELAGMGWTFFAVTDISRDGTMAGPDPGFYSPLVEEFPGLKIIGGGGVASMEHLLMLKACGLYAAVTGKALLEGKISPAELSTFIQP